MIGEQSQIMGDTEYLTNYAHIKHSHRHSHYHLRRQSQPDSDVRLMSRNSSSVKSFISQCYNNPEYFDEIRPARSYDDSRASLISRKLSNQIVLLNSELQLLEQMRDHSHSYPHINYPEKDYLSEKDQFHAEQTTTTSSTSSEECSDASEFHEKKASTLERKVSRLTSETDSYSAINDEITQLISKHFSNSIKQLVAQRFTDVGMYTLPLRRRHSCGSTESYDDIIIPELFNSPSRIKWNFLTGLPDHSRSHSRIDSSDYKTDLEDDDDECNNHPQGWRRCKRIDHNMKERKSFSFDSKQQQGYETVSMWRTNSYPETHESILQHDTEEFLDTYCEGHSKEFEHGQENSEEKVEDSGSVYEFELCTKENCEYLSKSQVMLPQQSTESENPLNNNKTFAINNSLPSNKNINLKHNKLKLKKKVKKKSTVKANHNRDPEDFLMWSKINFSHLIKKDSCNINSVNLKPNSNSSSSHSLNNMGVRNRRNKKSYQKFTNKWLQQQPPGSLDIATLILASSASTQVRFRSDGGIYFSNPDLSNIPVDLRSVTNFTNNNNNINSNNSCQFINNDLRNTINFNVNVNCHSIDHSHSRGRFDLASNYLTVEESSINSNNIDTFNDSEILQQQHLRGRLRYNRFNLNGIVRRAQKHARKYFNSLSFASRK